MYQFKSDHYTKIDIFEILNNSFEGLSKDSCDCLVSNGCGFAIGMLGRNLHSDYAVFVNDYYYLISHKDIKLIHFNERLLPVSKYLYKINLECSTSKKKSFAFNVFAKNFTSNIFTALVSITKYIYDHLSNRYFNGIKITSLSEVKDRLSRIFLFLKYLECVLDSSYIFNTTLILKQVSSILDDLVILGGARSLLEGNVMDFMNNLKFVLKIIY